ncbi:hypothetical protein ACLOJK_014971 [Asimina triloba]
MPLPATADRDGEQPILPLPWLELVCHLLSTPAVARLLHASDAASSGPPSSSFPDPDLDSTHLLHLRSIRRHVPPSRQLPNHSNSNSCPSRGQPAATP